MAVTQNTLIGRTKQSVGGVTFTTWKGLNVMKSKAVSVANPKTPAQLLQRAKLSLMVSIYRLISAPLQVGFNTQAIGKSEYNVFMSLNTNDATSGTTEANVAFVPANATMSKGTMGQEQIASITANPTQDTVTVTWVNNAVLGGSDDDLAYAIVYNETKDTWAFAEGTDTRADLSTIVTTPSTQAILDQLHIWLFFKSATSNEVPDSVYIADSV